MIDTLLQFIISLNDTQILILALIAMGLAIPMGRLLTGSWLIGILLVGIINCFNLTIYATAWLGLGIKPFMPLWVSFIIFVAPFFILFFHRLYFYQSLSEK